MADPGGGGVTMVITPGKRLSRDNCMGSMKEQLTLQAELIVTIARYLCLEIGSSCSEVPGSIGGICMDQGPLYTFE